VDSVTDQACGLCGQDTATGIHREATKGLCTNLPCVRPVTMRCILPDGSVYERCVYGHAVRRSR